MVDGPYERTTQIYWPPEPDAPPMKLRPDTARHTAGFSFVSPSSDTEYVIAWDVVGKFWGCSCKAGINRGTCKHLAKMYRRSPTRLEREQEVAREAMAAVRSKAMLGSIAPPKPKALRTMTEEVEAKQVRAERERLDRDRRAGSPIVRDYEQEARDRAWALAVLNGDRAEAERLRPEMSSPDFDATRAAARAARLFAENERRSLLNGNWALRPPRDGLPPWVPPAPPKKGPSKPPATRTPPPPIAPPRRKFRSDDEI